MNRILVLFMLLVVPAVAVAAPKDWSTATPGERQIEISKNATAGVTSASSVASDALQAVGRVVLKRATRAAWDELKQRLMKLAKCDETAGPLPRTCHAVESARIQDILASPKFLLDAFVGDLLGQLNLPSVGADLERVIEGWKRAGLSGALAGAKALVFQQIHAAANAATCPSIPQLAAFWVVARCLFDGTEANALLTCDLEKHIGTCVAADQPKIRNVVVLAADVFTLDKAVAPTAAVKLVFEWGKLDPAADVPLIEALQKVFVGLTSRDWMRATSGLGDIATRANAACPKKDECKVKRKLLALMGAVGEFAESYQDSKSDPAVAAKAREKVIEDLALSMVSRSDRESGAVLSLGGSLGLFGGLRYDHGGDDSQVAFPARLTLGLGLQTYSSKAVGLHVSIDAFDLGQYITYSDGDMDVASPELSSVVVAGASVGIWFMSREIPWFIAARGSVSPFVKTEDGRSTFEVGLLAGLYVPLLDFN